MLYDTTEQMMSILRWRAIPRSEASKANLLDRVKVFDPAICRRGKKRKTTVIINKTTHKKETDEASGSNVGPNAESREVKDPIGTLATLTSLEGPRKGQECTPHDSRTLVLSSRSISQILQITHKHNMAAEVVFCQFICKNNLWSGRTDSRTMDGFTKKKLQAWEKQK